MATATIFSSGIPTEPDVKKLLTTFTNLKAGVVITHTDIENTINVKPGTARYRTIVTAWRRRLLNEQNIDMEAVPSVGLRVLEPFERTTVSVRDFRRGVRRIGKSMSRIKRVPVEQLTPQEQVKTEHATRRIHATLATAQADRKAISVRFGPVVNPLRAGNDGTEE